MLVSEATVTVLDPQSLADRVIEHLVGHGVVFKERGGAMVAELTYGSGSLRVEGDAIKVRIEASDQGQLQTIRSVLASHLIELAGEPAPSIRWTGNEPTGGTFANFREVRLKRKLDLTPHMRRLTFTGDDINRFASDSDIHVRMYFPPPAVLTKPEWPRIGPDGRVIWPEPKPDVRYYTIRRIDLAAAEIDVDFVLHDDAGPGSDFAKMATPGALCGMAGPLGLNLTFKSWIFVAGDETALPAIARILETAPSSTAGQVFIEVADHREEMPLSHPRNVSVSWLCRDGAEPGRLLVDAVKAATWPDGQSLFAWAACEARALKKIRDHWRHDRRLDRESFLAVAYWNGGKAR